MLDAAKITAIAMHGSTPKQIEHWALLGMAVEETQDISAVLSLGSLKFPVVKLTDYHDKVEELLAVDNAFALITAAHILAQQTKQQWRQTN